MDNFAKSAISLYLTLVLSTLAHAQDFGSVSVSCPTNDEYETLPHFLWTRNPLDDLPMECDTTDASNPQHMDFLCELKTDVPLILGPVWCANTEAELKNSLEVLRLTILVNGQTVPAELLLSKRENHDRDYKGRCYITRTKFSSWRIGSETTVKMIESVPGDEGMDTQTTSFRISFPALNSSLKPGASQDGTQ